MICTWKARWFTPKKWQAGLPHRIPLRSWWLTRIFFRLLRRESIQGKPLPRLVRWNEQRREPPR